MRREALGRGRPFRVRCEGRALPKEFSTAVEKAMANGLDPDAALAALTTEPAALFGVARDVGTIEVGKIANLVVAGGSLAKDWKVKTVIIDGQKMERRVISGAPRTARRPKPDSISAGSGI